MEGNIEKEQIPVVVNVVDTPVEITGHTFKGRKELITEYWLKKKTEAFNRNEVYTDIHKMADKDVASTLYPFEGTYVIDAEGNARPIDKM